ncbi:MAG: rod shape-determining protein MreD [Clostridia bacterium]|nr:rod shape-determining protein MreD [Clostridia bacterium]
MRRIILPAMILIGIYLDSILFSRLNIGGIRPDALMSVVVSAGVLLGSMQGGLIGLGVGLFMDVLFGKFIGLSAMSYMTAGMVGGLFYQKFFADNVIVPAAVAAAGALLKEHIMMLAVLLNGGTFSYGAMLGGYVLPCTVLTLALEMPVHVLLKRGLARQVHAEHRSSRT